MKFAHAGPVGFGWLAGPDTTITPRFHTASQLFYTPSCNPLSPPSLFGEKPVFSARLVERAVWGAVCEVG